MAYIDTLILRLRQEKYHGGESVPYREDVERLKKSEPYEYVLGHTLFLGARIDLSLRPMIPRMESAFWLERAILELKKREKVLGRPLKIADIFAGSGALGVALALHFPTAYIDISELDPNLKRQIEINLEKNNIDEDRIRVITASTLEGLEGTYDAIVAVPPYIPHEALPELDQDMIEYEPHLAFFADENGHAYLKALITESRDYLEDGGTLFMEADMDDNEVVRELVEGTQWSSLEFWEDPYGVTPNVVLRR